MSLCFLFSFMFFFVLSKSLLVLHQYSSSLLECPLLRTVVMTYFACRAFSYPNVFCIVFFSFFHLFFCRFRSYTLSQVAFLFFFLCQRLLKLTYGKSNAEERELLSLLEEKKQFLRTVCFGKMLKHSKFLPQPELFWK